MTSPFVLRQSSDMFKINEQLVVISEPSTSVFILLGVKLLAYIAYLLGTQNSKHLTTSMPKPVRLIVT